MTPKQTLSVVQVGCAFLFWPFLALLLWAQLTPSSIDVGANDKVLHFGGYALLTALAVGALAPRRRFYPVVLAIFAVGVAVEVIQGFIGRDTSLGDVLANAGGIASGTLAARAAIAYLLKDLDDDAPRWLCRLGDQITPPPLRKRPSRGG